MVIMGPFYGAIPPFAEVFLLYRWSPQDGDRNRATA